jgi:hypothetical protein
MNQQRVDAAFQVRVREDCLSFDCRRPGLLPSFRQFLLIRQFTSGFQVLNDRHPRSFPARRIFACSFADFGRSPDKAGGSFHPASTQNPSTARQIHNRRYAYVSKRTEEPVHKKLYFFYKFCVLRTR